MKSVNITVDLEQVQKLYADEKKRARENMQKVTKQMARKVPRITGKRVSERYNIPASEVYPPSHKVKTDRKTGIKTKVKKATSVKIKGDTLDNLNFTWESRRLTVQRFKMKPKAVPKRPQKPYDISFEVLRGKQQGFKDTSRRFFVQDIKGVIQAVSATNNRSAALNRKIDRVEKTLSVPIMIDNAEVNKAIYRDINATLLEEIKKVYK